VRALGELEPLGVSGLPGCPRRERGGIGGAGRPRRRRGDGQRVPPVPGAGGRTADRPAAGIKTAFPCSKCCKERPFSRLCRLHKRPGNALARRELTPVPWRPGGGP
jgi:hypothetical protein